MHRLTAHLRAMRTAGTLQWFGCFLIGAWVWVTSCNTLDSERKSKGAKGILSATSRGSKALVDLTPCRVAGLRDAARCGQLEVFEDRQAGAGREIVLHFAVVPALAPTARPDPLFLLMGGPGQSALGSGPGMVHALEAVRRYRDIVLLDQRGTGRSHPLQCASDEAKSLAEVFRPTLERTQLRECLKHLEANPIHYATPTAMDDLDDVRRALGYEQINLWGGSYGTRAALVYSRRHPKAVRRMVLDGVAPLEIQLPLHAGDDAQRVVNLLSERCAQQPDCARQVPDVQQLLSAIVERLNRQPQHLSVEHPRTGKRETVTMTGTAFALGLRGPLYVPSLAAMVPTALAAVEAGDFRPYLALALTVADGISSDMAVGMMLSVLCAEDLSRLQEEQVAKYSHNFLGRAAMDAMGRSCEVWPHAKLPPEYFGPMTSDAPTLILSGQLDPVTPPRWGEVVNQQLHRAKHVVVSGLSHGVSTHSCLPSAIAEFLDSPNPLDIEVPCADRLSPPPLFVRDLGGEP